jgi:hypothetical protein
MRTDFQVNENSLKINKDIIFCILYLRIYYWKDSLRSDMIFCALGLPMNGIELPIFKSNAAFKIVKIFLAINRVEHFGKTVNFVKN